MDLLKKSLINAINNILRNKLINFLCLGIISFTLLTLGIFNYISYNLEIFTQNFSKNVEAIFYLKNDVKEKEIKAQISKIKGSLLVDEIIYKSRDEAEINFLAQFPELKYILSEFDKSPFPSSIEIKFKQKESNLTTKIISFIEDIEKSDIVESKQVNIDWAKKVLYIKKFISITGIFLSGILFFVSIFIIYNVIKLNILYRKEEIDILQFVGATDWYIKFPFIIEGALMGLLGGLIAGFLLIVSIKLIPSYSDFIAKMLKEIISFKKIPLKILIRLLFFGTAIGLISSLFSLKKFFKK
jgi:cell division transport system permease protein